MAVQGLSEPPEGVLSGDSIPRENEHEEHRFSKIRQVANEMKSHPRFHGMDTGEIVEYIKEME